MRTIKFRAWDEQRKVMHHDFQFIKSGDEGNDWIIPIKPISDPEWMKCLTEDSLTQAPHFRQQFILMQFTGLHDKNGKEIYEGDILRGMYGEQKSPDDKLEPILGEVSWRRGRWIAGFLNSSKDLHDLDGNHAIYWRIENRNSGRDWFYRIEGIEVIGNIYENPELVKSDA